MSPTIRLPSPSSDYPLKHIKTGVSHLKNWQLTPVSVCFIIVLLHFIHFLYTFVAILTDILPPTVRKIDINAFRDTGTMSVSVPAGCDTDPYAFNDDCIITLVH